MFPHIQYEIGFYMQVQSNKILLIVISHALNIQGDSFSMNNNGMHAWRSFHPRMDNMVYISSNVQICDFQQRLT